MFTNWTDTLPDADIEMIRAAKYRAACYLSSHRTRPLADPDHVIDRLSTMLDNVQTHLDTGRLAHNAEE